MLKLLLPMKQREKEQLQQLLLEDLFFSFLSLRGQRSGLHLKPASRGGLILVFALDVGKVEGMQKVCITTTIW
jgi:hypothetical protein